MIPLRRAPHALRARRAPHVPRVLTLLVIALLAVPAWGARGLLPIRILYPAPRDAEIIRPISIGPISYVSTNDIARVFGATKFWRPELRKLTLRIGNHTVRLTVDAPIVLVDEEMRYIVHPPRLVQGVVHVPEPVLAGLFDSGVIPDAVWDGEQRVVRFRSEVHTVRQAQLWVRGRVTEVAATLARTAVPRVLYATPAEVRLLFEGATLDTERVFAGGVVATGSMREARGGVELRLLLGQDAKGYSVSTGSSRLKVAVTDDDGLVSAGLFNPLEPLPLGGPDRGLRTIVIDPGHGGKDVGVPLPGGQVEKEVALEIARLLRSELQRRLDARVLLTRESDTDLTLTRRAEVANEAEADLFVSLHVDADGALRAGGVRVLSVSPTAADAEPRVPIPLEGGRAADRSAAELVPWRAAQLRECGTSMAVGQAVADALHRTFPQSPVIVGYGGIGVLDPVLCPAVLIEIAPAPRGGPDAMSLRGYTLQEIVRTVAQAIQDLARGERA